MTEGREMLFGLSGSSESEERASGSTSSVLGAATRW